jgi:hypothetical protein
MTSASRQNSPLLNLDKMDKVGIWTNNPGSLILGKWERMRMMLRD